MRRASLILGLLLCFGVAHADDGAVYGFAGQKVPGFVDQIVQMMRGHIQSKKTWELQQIQKSTKTQLEGLFGAVRPLSSCSELVNQLTDESVALQETLHDDLDDVIATDAVFLMKAKPVLQEMMKDEAIKTDVALLKSLFEKVKTATQNSDPNIKALQGSTILFARSIQSKYSDALTAKLATDLKTFQGKEAKLFSQKHLAPAAPLDSPYSIDFQFGQKSPVLSVCLPKLTASSQPKIEVSFSPMPRSYDSICLKQALDKDKPEEIEDNLSDAVPGLDGETGNYVLNESNSAKSQAVKLCVQYEANRREIESRN